LRGDQPDTAPATLFDLEEFSLSIEPSLIPPPAASPRASDSSNGTYEMDGISLSTAGEYLSRDHRVSDNDFGKARGRNRSKSYP